MKQPVFLRHYPLSSPKISANVRAAFLSDLHSCRFGENQTQLQSTLSDLQPDLVLLGGDLIDDRLPASETLAFLEAISKKWPCFYACGNHELRSGLIDRIKARLQRMGIQVLAGTCCLTSVNGVPLQICGVDDADIGMRLFRRQLAKAAQQINPAVYSVLLSHRPDLIYDYLEYPFDLMLSGHAHGGQWRIPGLLNGLYAPDQGLFPQYAGGLYQFHKKVFIVSRGLAKESTPLVPRIFNPCELVVIDWKPEKKS